MRWCGRVVFPTPHRGILFILKGFDMAKKKLSVNYDNLPSLFGGGRVLKFYKILQSKLPILAFEKQIGFVAVGHSHLLGIPLQTLAGKLAGDHTET